MNINNIKNLIKAYFIENWKRDVIWTFLLLAIITMVMVLMSPYSLCQGEMFVMLIMLFIFPGRVFNNLYGSSKSIHYLMIPANSREKVAVNMFLLNVYAVIGVLLSVLVGFSVAYLIMKLRGIEGFSTLQQRYDIGGNDSWILVLAVYTMLSFFFFGSVYFKKRATLSTFGIGVLLFLAFVLIVMFTLWFNSRIAMHTGFHNIYYTTGFFDKNGKAMGRALYILADVITMVFFYTLSFIRLRETEA